MTVTHIHTTHTHTPSASESHHYVQPIALGVSFLHSQISIDDLVLQVSFTTFRWKESKEIWDWRLDLNDVPNAIGYVSQFASLCISQMSQKSKHPVDWYWNISTFCRYLNVSRQCDIASNNSRLQLGWRRILRLFLIISRTFQQTRILPMERLVPGTHTKFQENSGMGLLRVVGSLKLQVSIAEYSLFYRALLQKRPMILRSLLNVATPNAWN